MKANINLQDCFLNQARKENIMVNIFLVSGASIRGIVKGFDAFTIILEQPSKPWILIYKHAVASIAPKEQMKGFFDMPCEDYINRIEEKEDSV